MAIPKTLREITPQAAERAISRHMKQGTGYWEGSPMYSDFVYRNGNGFMLVRPPCCHGGNWETGKVSM